jgi:hypothetical protein
LKRAPFLGATTAVFLAGCGGHSAMRALPGVAPLAPQNKSGPSTTLRLIPTAADSVPSNVLATPIIGEAWRFDGAAAPANWMLAKGQTLESAANPQLFSVLAKHAAPSAKSFTLPNPPFGMIIAVAGTSPTSPTMLAQSSGRHLRPSDSLGPNARPAPLPRIKPAAPELLAERKLAMSQPAVRGGAAVPVSAELAGRIRTARDDARTSTIAVLSPSNQARLEAAVQDAVAGRTTVYGAVRTMSSSLSGAETTALLRLNDAMTRPFNPSAGVGSINPQDDAAHFLISVAFTPDQVRVLNDRERSAN